MSQRRPHRALEWLSRRHDGESVALIAARDGVSEETVRNATSPYGPFPRPTRQLGRTHLPDEVIDARTRRWVAARRNGEPITTVAARDGVAHQLVSRHTAPWGPFPSEEVAQQWTASRHAGRSLAAIAEEYGTTIGKVRASTRPFGPFRPPGPRLPDGVVGVKGLAQMAWVSHPTAARWVRTGRTPAPDFVTATGRTVWQAATIAAWLRDSDFAHCPDCGARCVSLSWHRAQAHRA